MFSRIIKWLITIIILIALGYGLYYYFAVKTSQPLATADTPYTVSKKTLINKISASGVISANKETVVAAPYAGYIQKIYVNLGQHVVQGDPLVSIVSSLQSPEKVYPIRAPYAGTVVYIKKSEGEYVTQGSGSTQNSDFILKVDDLSKLYVTADIAESNILQMKKGLKVMIKASANNNTSFDGVITSVALAPSPNNSGTSFNSTQQTTYPIRVLITTKNADLLPGMNVVCDIYIDEKQDVIALPKQYIRIQDGHNYVKLSNGKMQEVSLGIQTTQDVEITKGLTVGDQVEPINYFSGV
ncbi:HlyD family efflux transporter periplasmic adaptor subunit [Cysteiniphilum sp. QT6929]|uniref:efflux RND transporter periplasmic adaptor subunit n=1 Tax=Cysteiniphilum sp. QT6929 TaxID=2975055 RepID=UPI0024B3B709|nr:HlyD family efflux transporter periplasmic adaptor subunit [Cysteiniphilum sp. QT6929]WHN64747.1 HlyD family efflux transporter periplasmic adaptor subunit [Cysteiniphilum sp. QT6929]